ncbi:unnamed protein product [Cylindrotheca closterium]|uniref:SLC41A/MgtE integral membrane domain-containing protein n=1 Tax=Cylindrotheca closterium TaxID=2856 RepID=A0AAD2FUI1_9STRA|nr:unnamed protein product [Cylindrotheca closterium]
MTGDVPSSSSSGQYVAPDLMSGMATPIDQRLLRDENGYLRQEIASLKEQLAVLQFSIRNERQNIPKAKTSGGAIELPAPSVVQNINHSHKAKTSPASERHVIDVESGSSIAYHESSPGLYHRNNRPLHNVSGPSIPNKDDASPNEYTALSPPRPTPRLTPDDGLRRDSPGVDENNFLQSVVDRAGWLVGLLILQSMSSFIIARNETLLQQHGVIVQFLTMLVGAGGNAGNQASVRVIRGLATGSIDHTNTRPFLRRELFMGLCLSIILAVAGFGRALVFFTPWPETFAITISLFIIVACSVVIGSLLPLGMRSVGIDPAHSSTTIQVIMDILGVLITVKIGSWILDSIFAGGSNN